LNIQSPYDCPGQHRYFVAETGVDAEGKICIIVVCTACGESKLIEHAVAGSVILKKEKGK